MRRQISQKSTFSTLKRHNYYIIQRRLGGGETSLGHIVVYIRVYCQWATETLSRRYTKKEEKNCSVKSHHPEF